MTHWRSNPIRILITSFISACNKIWPPRFQGGQVVCINNFNRGSIERETGVHAPAGKKDWPKTNSASLLLTEQAHDVLRGLVRNRQRLCRQLLLNLISLQTCSFFFHVGVNHFAYAIIERVCQAAQE